MILNISPRLVDETRRSLIPIIARLNCRALRCNTQGNAAAGNLSDETLTFSAKLMSCCRITSDPARNEGIRRN